MSEKSRELLAENEALALDRAALSGDLSSVQRLLHLGVSPRVTRLNQFQRVHPLFKAVAGAVAYPTKLEIVKSLLKAGARCTRGDEALIEAAKFGHVEIVEMLLKAGGRRPDLSDWGKCGYTALHEAAIYGHTDIVEMMLKLGAPVDLAGEAPEWREKFRRKKRKKRKMTPLQHAAANGRFETCQLLMAYGASVYPDTPRGESRETVERGNRGGPTRLCYSFYDRQNRKRKCPKLADWLDLVTGWSTLQIAFSLQRYAEAEAALRLGSINPDDPEVYDAEEKAVVMDAAQQASEPNRAMELVRLAFSGWSEYTHRLHHIGVRKAVWIYMLVAQRVDCGSEMSAVRFIRLPDGAVLPMEMWFRILAFIVRQDWPSRYYPASLAAQNGPSWAASHGEQLTSGDFGNLYLSTSV
jgi:hypothetical protein